VRKGLGGLGGRGSAGVGGGASAAALEGGFEKVLLIQWLFCSWDTKVLTLQSLGGAAALQGDLIRKHTHTHTHTQSQSAVTAGALRAARTLVQGAQGWMGEAWEGSGRPSPI
jgi:hypothetical protein